MKQRISVPESTKVLEKTVIRVAEESLRCLASKLPNEFPLPDETPATHVAGSAALAGGRGRQRGGRGNGNRSKRGSRGGRSGGVSNVGGDGAGDGGGAASGLAPGVGKSVARREGQQRASRGGKTQSRKRKRRGKQSSSDEESSPAEISEEEFSPSEDEEEEVVRNQGVQHQVHNDRAWAVNSDEDSDGGYDGGEVNEDSSSGSDHDDDDPPPTIPQGYHTLSEWQPCDPVDAFMLWTQMSGKGSPDWHCMKVLKVLSDKRWTYDAHEMGRPKERRGVKITQQHFREGTFIPLVLTSAVNEDADAQHSVVSPDKRGRCTATDDMSHEQVQRTRPARQPREIPFHCRSCQQVDDFLYCPPDSEDGIAPQLMCRACKPLGWVCISRADYRRVVTGSL